MMAWRIFIAFLAWSIFFNATTAAIDPQLPTEIGNVTAERLENPGLSDNFTSAFFATALPRLKQGQLGMNFGNQFLGLGGVLSLVPLVVVWLAAIVYLRRSAKSVTATTVE